MAFTIDESFLPATLAARAMTDQEFADFCSGHPDLFFEMTAEGEITVMAPTYSEGGIRSGQAFLKLGVWAEQDGRGEVFDSSTGFVLPNGARRSPDASWIDRRKIEKLGRDGRKGFWHLCPDFVIEIVSETDRVNAVRKKMREYMANGAQLGWLIDPKDEVAEIYRPESEPEVLKGVRTVKGEGPVLGFELDLIKIWNPLG